MEVLVIKKNKYINMLYNSYKSYNECCNLNIEIKYKPKLGFILLH